MDIPLIISIVVLSFLALVSIFVFLVPYLTYKICFLSVRGKKKKKDAYAELVNAAFEPYREKFESLKASLLSREYEKCKIKSYDGLLLRAKYYKGNEGEPLHILFHGYRSSANVDFCGGAEECIKLSHSVLLVDQRAHGESEGKTISFGINEKHDLHAWVNFAISKFGKDVKIFIWGISMGAATVLMSLDKPLPENVVGAIADCPYSSPEEIIRKVGKGLHLPVGLLFPFLKLGARMFGGFRFDNSAPLLAVKSARIPILLIHGESDSYVPHYMSEKIVDAAKEAGVNLRFVSFPEAEHAMSYLSDSERYVGLVRGFIEEAMENAALK